MTHLGTPPSTDTFAAALSARRRARRVPALSAAVARRGDVVWAGAAGAAGPGTEATSATAFRIGSISKPMTAVAVLRLVEAGRVRLDDAVGRHVPDAPASSATIAQLLTHTAGLPAEPLGPWWERHGGCTWDDLVATRLAPLWEPGERFHYSNVGYAVLGRLVEQAHGRAWDDVLRTEVWEPLGMGSTGRTPRGPHARGYAVHPHAELVLAEPVAEYLAMGPAGEVWSTPSDLVRFGAWLAGTDNADDRVLPVAWRRRMTSPRVVVDELGAPFTSAWGLGVSVRHDGAGATGRRTFGHGGSVPGFTAELRVDASTGEAVALCGSSTAGAGDTNFLFELLEALPDGTGGVVAAAGDTGADVADVAVPEALALTGNWYWGPMPYTIRLDAAGRLELRADAEGGRATLFERLVPDGTDAGAGDGVADWIGVDGGYWRGERLRAVRAGTGGAVAALDVGTFHFTRTPYDPATAVPGGIDPAGWQPPPVG
jgi:CubicO group peptidase (beta-lactamase class C family)